ncbi:unnamed protein product, partial [Heterosigma akashiwo]
PRPSRTPWTFRRWRARCARGGTRTSRSWRRTSAACSRTAWPTTSRARPSTRRPAACSPPCPRCFLRAPFKSLEDTMDKGAGKRRGTSERKQQKGFEELIKQNVPILAMQSHSN